MLTTTLIVTGIGLMATLSYFTSARFGCQSSQTGPLPPHYEQLLRNRRQPPQATDDPITKPDRNVPDEPASILR